MRTTLLLVRHGRTLGDLEDPGLSSKGRERVGITGNALWRLGLRMDRLIHAPSAAAVETMELLRGLVAGEIRETERLLRSPDEHLLALLEGATIGVVGHQPWLGELAAWLVVGQRTRGDLLEIRKGGLVHLRGRLEPGRMKLRGLYSNRALRALG